MQMCSVRTLFLSLLIPGLAQACTEPVGINVTEQPGVVVFGEYHGTNEIPHFFHDVVCTITERTQGTLLVALELPNEFNALFARAGEDPQEELIARIRDLPFWDEFGDGRHSRAMLQLVERLVATAHAEPRVKLTAFARKNIDIDGAGFLSNVIRSNGAKRTLILVGNAHARLTPLMKGRPTMAMSLRDQHGLNVHAYDISAGDGAAWVCLPECAARQVLRTRREPGIHASNCQFDCGFEGYFHVPVLSIAPAVDPN